MAELTTIIGIIGLIFILSAFFLNLIHKLGAKSKIYLLMNIVGSAILSYYALFLNSMPFSILQVIWGMLALIKLIFIFFKKSRKSTGFLADSKFKQKRKNL